MTGFDGSESSPPPPPPRPIEHRDVDASGWWLSLLVGVAQVGLGVWMLTNLFESVVVLAWLVGISLIVGGVVEVLALGGRHALGWGPVSGLVTTGGFLLAVLTGSLAQAT